MFARKGDKPEKGGGDDVKIGGWEGGGCHFFFTLFSDSICVCCRKLKYQAYVIKNCQGENKPPLPH